jgi:hypothetical protein
MQIPSVTSQLQTQLLQATKSQTTKPATPPTAGADSNADAADAAKPEKGSTLNTTA